MNHDARLPAMQGLSRRRIAMVSMALMATAATLSYESVMGAGSIAQPMPSAPDLAGWVPDRFLHWRQDHHALLSPIDAKAALKAGAVYVKTFEAVYVDDENRRVMLSITWGSQQGDHLQAHRPEFCYEAQGFSILGVQDTTLETAQGLLPVRRLHTLRPGRVEPVSYWMTVGDTATLPGLPRKLAQIRRGLLGQPLQGALVRVSSLTASPEEAYALHDRFIADLLSVLTPAQRSRLAGLAGQKTASSGQM